MNEPKLHDFTKTMLEDYIFPGTDAAMVFVADDAAPPPVIKEVLARSRQQRWYPVTGGHQAKIPFHFVAGHEELFEREPKGWNHEHCDFCDASIDVGELCWTAPSKHGVFVFCKACYEKLPVKKPWWRFWR